jgi:hypothetical protein
MPLLGAQVDPEMRPAQIMSDADLERMTDYMNGLKQIESIESTFAANHASFADQMEMESMRIANTFGQIGSAMASAIGEMIKGEKDMGDIVAGLLQSIIQVVAGYLAQSVAASFAGGASVGGPAAPFTGAAAAATAMSLFSSLVPALMAEGGIVPGGYPNDSYPALLTSGERVVPPDKLDSMGGARELRGKFRIEGSDLVYIIDREQQRRNRYN